MKTTVIDYSNKVEMISRIFVRQPLKALAPALFLLLCCSIGAFAQSPSETQELGRNNHSVNFKEASVKKTIEALGRQLKLNVVFDDSVKEFDKFTLELEDVTIEQAVKIILIQKKLQARIIEENTIIVFPDNAANRQRYGQYELWPAKSGGNR